MKKPKLRKYPVGGYIQDKNIHYLNKGEQPMTPEQLSGYGYSLVGNTGGYGEYTSNNGMNRNFYKPIAYGSPEWNNSDNPLYKASNTALTNSTPVKPKPDLRWPTRTDYSAGSVGPRYQETPTFKNGGTLPKFFGGGRHLIASAADQKAINDEQNQQNTSEDGSIDTGTSSQNYGKYVAAGTIASTGIANSANTINSNASLRQKSESMDGTVVGTASAINPIVGSIIGIGDTIGKPIRNNAEQMDSNGNLKNQNAAQTGAIVGGLFDPIKALTTRSSYNGGFTDLTGKGYANALEKEAKGKLAVDTPYIPKEKDPQDQVWAKQNNYNTFTMGGKQQSDSTEYYKKQALIALMNNKNGIGWDKNTSEAFSKMNHYNIKHAGSIAQTSNDVIHAPELDGYFRKRRK